MSFVVKKSTALAVVILILGLSLIYSGWQRGGHEASNTDAQAVSEVLDDTSGEETLSFNRDMMGMSENSPDEYFIEAKLERERTRGQQINLIREVISSAASNDEARQRAQDSLLSISGKMAKELELENLIMAKGFKNAVVYYEDRGVTVVVQTQDLSQEDALKISDVISRGTGINENNIVIIPKP